MSEWDIYNYKNRLKWAIKKINESKISKENKILIKEFDRACVIEGLTIGRRVKLLSHMKFIAEQFLPIPFSKAKKKDIQEAIVRIESKSTHSHWMKRDNKLILRKFFKWFVFRDSALEREDFPEIVAWIKPHIKKKDRCRVHASDLVTIKEVEMMIRATNNLRNRAFIGMIYELGARIGEMGTLRIGDISRDKYSFLIDLDGKTGKRNVRVVLYANHLVNWLNIHPDNKNPASPLWPSLISTKFLKPLPYRTLLSIVKKSSTNAGIKKRVYPHLFRHSRSTHLLATGKLNESQAKKYFGWVPDSRVLSTYAHLVTNDANDAILRMYGIQKSDERKNMDGKSCGMCKTTNPTSSSFCFHCGYSLSFTKVEESEKRIDNAEELLNSFLKIPEVRSRFKQMIRSQKRN